MKLARIANKTARHRILMNVIPMMREVPSIANPVIGKPALPHFGFSSNNIAERVRISAFDELDSALDGYVPRRSKHKMNMIGHQDERVQRKAAFAAVVIKSLKEQSGIGIDYKKFAVVPCRESQKVGSGRGKEPGRLRQ